MRAVDSLLTLQVAKSTTDSEEAWKGGNFEIFVLRLFRNPRGLNIRKESAVRVIKGRTVGHDGGENVKGN